MDTSEIWNIALTAIVTILGGIAIFVLSRFVMSLFIEPIIKFRGLIGEIRYSLIYYADIYCNPPDNINSLPTISKYSDVNDKFRFQASQIRAFVEMIIGYSLWANIGLIPSKKNMVEVSSELIGLSNSVYGGPGINGAGNIKIRKRIEKLLNNQNKSD